MISAETLAWLRINGQILEAAPADASGRAIDTRREDEAHACLICGGRAQAAYIADTDAGPRWLDLCMPDSWRVRQILAAAPSALADGQ